MRRWIPSPPAARAARQALEHSLVAGGVRTTVAALAPLIVGHAVGQPSLGSIMAIGALNVALTDVGGLYRSKALAMAVATLGVSTAAAAGTLAGGTLWLAALVAFTIAFACGLAGIYGNAANKVSLSILSTFVITLGLPGGAAIALERSAACLAGGVWAMALSLWLWPTHPLQPAREAVIDYYRALRRFMSRALQVGNEAAREAIPGRDTRDAGGRRGGGPPERTAVVEAGARARETLLTARASAQGANPVGERLLLLALNADSLFDAAVALAAQREIAARYPLNAEIESLVQQAGQQVLAVTGGIADAIARTFPAAPAPLPAGAAGRTVDGLAAGSLDLTALDRTIEALHEQVTRLRKTTRDLPATYPALVALRNLARIFERVGVALHGAADAVQQSGVEGREVEHRGGDARLEPTTASEPLSMLRDNLTFQSLAFRHALRLGVTMAIAVALYMALGLSHGYWVTLTVIVVLKPDYGGTIERAVQRVVGTVIGGLLAAVLVTAVRSEVAIYVLMVPLGILAFSQLPRNYGLYVALLTPFVVLMIDLAAPGDWRVAATRAFNTVIGGALALLAGTLFWPSWEGERLPEQLARTIAANRDYFHQVLSAYLGSRPDAAAIRRAREQAQVENANAAAAFQRLLSVPPWQRGAVEPIYELVTANRQFYDGVTALAAHLPAFSGRHVLPGLRRLAAQIESLLENLVEAVRLGQRPEPMPALEKSLPVVRAAIRKLMAQRVTELAREQTDSPKRQAVLDYSPLTAGLRRLAHDAVAMHRAQTRASGHEARP